MTTIPPIVARIGENLADIAGYAGAAIFLSLGARGLCDLVGSGLLHPIEHWFVVAAAVVACGVVLLMVMSGTLIGPKWLLIGGGLIGTIALLFLIPVNVWTLTGSLFDAVVLLGRRRLLNDDARELCARTTAAIGRLFVGLVHGGWSNWKKDVARRKGKASGTSSDDLSRFEDILNPPVRIEDYLTELEPQPAVARDEEVAQALAILQRAGKSNPVFIGEAGVGKTTIVRGLQLQLETARSLPKALGRRRIFELSIPALMGGARYQGDIEKRVNAVIEFAQKPNVILFIDELHTIANAHEGAPKLTDLLKPALADGSIKLIGATTLDEYRVLERDPALARRLDVVRVEPTNPAQTVEILADIRPKIGRTYKTAIDEALLPRIVELTDRFMSSRNQPDKSIDVLEQAAVDAAGNVLTIETIEAVVARKAHLPLEQVSPQAHQGEDLLNLDRRFEEHVVGQPDAVEAVARAIRRSRAGLRDPNRPIFSGLFYGGRGTGKTELAEALAEIQLGSRQAALLLDMSEFQSKESLTGLIGTPPGYQGSETGGRLTEAVRRNPHLVVIFDELEKAHPDVFDLLLQVLEKGRLTDARGTVVDFRDSYIVATSNLLSRESLAYQLRPEIIDRFDEVIEFRPLDEDAIAELIRRQLEARAEQVQAQRQIELRFTPRVYNLFAGAGFKGDEGARPLRRSVQRLLVDPLAEQLLAGRIQRGDVVQVDVQGAALTFAPVVAAASTWTTLDPLI